VVQVSAKKVVCSNFKVVWGGLRYSGRPVYGSVRYL